MKKLIAATLVVMMVFSLVACGSSSNSQQPDPEIEAYVNQNRSQLISSMESSFASSSGMTCSSSIKTVGKGFIITLKINELDNLSSDIKNQMQSMYDAMQSTFNGMLTDLRAELPTLEYFTIEVCEKDGDIIATINANR